MNTIELERQRLHISWVRIGVAATGMSVAWMIGLGAGGLAAFVGTHAGLSNVLPQAPALLISLLGAVMTFVVPGGLAFATVTSAWHHVVLFPYLPESVPVRCFRAAFLGSIGYWLVSMSPLLVAFITPTSALQFIRNKTSEGAASLLLETLIVGASGALIGIAGSLVLMSAEGPVIRPYISNAKHWAAALIVSSALISSAFLLTLLVFNRNGS